MSAACVYRVADTGKGSSSSFLHSRAGYHLAPTMDAPKDDVVTHRRGGGGTSPIEMVYVSAIVDAHDCMITIHQLLAADAALNVAESTLDMLEQVVVDLELKCAKAEEELEDILSTYPLTSGGERPSCSSLRPSGPLSSRGRTLAEDRYATQELVDLVTKARGLMRQLEEIAA